MYNAPTVQSYDTTLPAPGYIAIAGQQPAYQRNLASCFLNTFSLCTVAGQPPLSPINLLKGCWASTAPSLWLSVQVKQCNDLPLLFGFAACL